MTGRIVGLWGQQPGNKLFQVPHLNAVAVQVLSRGRYCLLVRDAAFQQVNRSEVSVFAYQKRPVIRHIQTLPKRTGRIGDFSVKKNSAAV
jgi:hypothetical protein